MVLSEVTFGQQRCMHYLPKARYDMSSTHIYCLVYINECLLVSSVYIIKGMYYSCRAIAIVCISHVDFFDVSSQST